MSKKVKLVETQRIQSRDENGKMVYLKENDPWPHLSIQKISSKTIKRSNTCLSTVRLEVEDILHVTCGEQDVVTKLKDLSPHVPEILMKIALSAYERGCKCSAGAISALGHFRLPEVVDFLEEIADNRYLSDGLRTRSIVSLGKIGSPQSVDRLKAVLSRSKSTPLRSAAAYGLGLSGSRDVVYALEQSIMTDSDESVKQHAFGALKSIENSLGKKISSMKQPPIPKSTKPKPINQPKNLF